MDLSKIVIVTRTTPIDFDMREYSAGCLDDLLKAYAADKMPQNMIEDKIRRHEAQKKFLEDLQTNYSFASEQFIKNEELKAKQDLLKKAGLVISFGGDDTFTRISHFVDSTPIMGLKADCGSYGFLLYYNCDNLEAALERIKGDDYAIEKWTRLQAFVRGEPIEKAMGQYVLSATFAEKHMAKFCIQHRGITDEVWGSELVVCTGAGSTGQARSITWYLGEKAKPFRPTEKKAKFAMGNPHSPDKTPFERYKLLYGELREDEELVLVSKCKTKGQLLRETGLETGHITSDAGEDHFFKEGSEIKIKISDIPLNVIYVPGIALFSEKKWCSS